jgi:hypothetical protein
MQVFQHFHVVLFQQFRQLAGGRMMRLHRPGGLVGDFGDLLARGGKCHLLWRIDHDEAAFRR